MFSKTNQSIHNSVFKKPLASNSNIQNNAYTLFRYKMSVYRFFLRRSFLTILSSILEINLENKLDNNPLDEFNCRTTYK